MKQRTALIVVALAGVLVLGLLAFSMRSGASPAESASSAAPELHARPATATVLEDTTSATRVARDAAPDTAAAKQPEARVLPDGEGIEVLVVDEAGQPIGGAELTHLAAASEDEPFLYALAAHCELDAVLAKSGTRYFVDEKGRSRVPALTGNSAIVVARADRRYGSTVIGKGNDPPITLALYPVEP